MSILCLLVLFSLLFGGLSAQAPPIVDLGYVKYSGFQNATAGLNYYRGVRFAEPPSGDLRCTIFLVMDLI